MSAQDSTLHIYLHDDTVHLNEHFCLTVRANSFASIEAFQLSINFDPYLLDFDSVGQLNQTIDLDESFFGLQETHIGIVRLGFFDPFESYTLPDSAVLFSLCFTAYGQPGELCPVNLADFPLPLEFISNEQVIDDFTRRDGRVEVVGGDSLTLITSSCKTGLDDSTGTLSVSAYGGNPPYFILWQHTFNSDFSGGFGLDTFGDTRVISNLIEGRYRLTITDEDGNRFRDSINLRKANDLVYSTLVGQPTCDNTPDGVIVIDSVQGGIVPAQFKWSDGVMFSQERYDLFAGEYTITITQPLGCRITDTFLLQANSIQTTIIEEDETCLDRGDGRFQIDVFGGDPIDSLGYVIFYKEDTITGSVVVDSLLSAGTHPVLILDSIGCEKKVDVSIGTGLSFGVDELMTDNVSCFGDSSGSIYLEPKTITGLEILPYHFEWSNADSAMVDSSSILLFDLPNGNYSITVTSDGLEGCAWDTTFIITQPPFMNVQTASITPASCDPDNDGEATINITGGTPDGDGGYLIIWDNLEDSTTAVQLSADTHSVRVIDLEGCVVEHEVVIPNTDPPTVIGASIRNMRCDSAAIGSILTIFSSPFGIEKYRWSTGDSTSSIDNIGPGLYEVTVTDRNGCTDTFNFRAEIPIGPNIDSLLIQNIQCAGDTNGRLDVVFTMGEGDIDRIEWNEVVGTDSLLNLRSGGYNVIVYDNNACVDSAATTIVEPEVLDVDFDVSDDVNDTGVGSILATVSGGWSPYEYDWMADTIPTDSAIYNLHAGTYFLQLVDAEGCIIMDTVQVFSVSSVKGTLQDVFTIVPYPNPASSVLNFDQTPLKEETGFSFVIYDMHGMNCLSGKLESLEDIVVDISTLANGAYTIIWVSEQGGVFGSRFIKQRDQP